MSNPLSERELVEIEARVKENDSLPRIEWEEESEFIAHVRKDIPALVAEVRRLRSLFTEADAREVDLYAGSGDPLYEVPELRDLARRIREAVGTPKFIGQPQADAIIQSMIDDGTIGPDSLTSEKP
jgi:hypothetical protein